MLLLNLLVVSLHLLSILVLTSQVKVLLLVRNCAAARFVYFAFVSKLA